MPGMTALGFGPQDPYSNMFQMQRQGAGINPFSIPFMPSPEAIQQLQQAGVNFPQQLRQNLFMPEAGGQGYFGRHPGLASGIEGAMLGAANTPGVTGPEGAGGGIARAMQGMLGVPQYKREYQSAQIAAPFQQAEQLGGLRQAAEQLKATQAFAKYWGDQGDVKRQVAETQQAGALQREQDREQERQQLAELQDALKRAQEQPFPRFMQHPDERQTILDYLRAAGQSAPTTQAAGIRGQDAITVAMLNQQKEMDALRERFNLSNQAKGTPTFKDSLAAQKAYLQALEDPSSPIYYGLSENELSATFGQDTPERQARFFQMFPNFHASGPMQTPLPGMQSGQGTSLMNQPAPQVLDWNQVPKGQ